MRLATVMFSDIVSSTERAAEIGDRRWRDLLDRHDAVIRQELARHGARGQDDGGQVPRPVRRARPVDPLRRGHPAGAPGRGRRGRIGLHAGEVELRGDDLGGIAVHLGARVVATASPGEVVVSSTVRDLVGRVGDRASPTVVSAT